MADDRTEGLVLTRIEVDAETGKANLREFAKEAETAASRTEAATKRIDASLGKTDAAIAQPVDKLKELQGLLDTSRTKSAALAQELAQTGESGAAAAEGISAGLGGIAIAAGVAGGAIFGIVKGLGAFAAAADPITAISRGFEALTARTGESASTFLTKLRPATLGLVSDLELMKATNEAIQLGLPITSDKMAELAGVAVRLGRNMGVDAARSIESVTLGVGRQSSKLLDNVGIVVRSSEAYAAYAKEHGTTAEALSETQRQEAFLNASLVAGEKALSGQVAVLPSFSEEWKRVGVSIGNAKTGLLDFVNVAAGQALVAANLSAFVASQQNAAITSGMAAQEKKLDAAATEQLTGSLRDLKAEGLGVAESIAGQTKALQALGIDAIADGARVRTMRDAVGELRALLAQTPDTTTQDVIRIKIAELEHQIKTATEAAVNLKGTLATLSLGPAGSTFFSGQPGQTVPNLPTATGVQPFDSSLVSQSKIVAGFGASEETKKLDLLKGDDGRAELSARRIAMEKKDYDDLLALRAAQEFKWSAQQLQIELDRETSDYNARMAAEIKLGADTTSLTQGFEARKQAIRDKFRRADLQNDQILAQQKKQLLASSVASVGGAVSELFGKSKAGAIAAAVINTAAAIMQALATIPPPYSYVVAGVSAAIGVAQIAKIRSTSLDGGGSAGGVGASAPAAVDYSVATRTPSGDVTGTTPVIAQGAKSVKASASAPVVTGETATAKKTKAYQAASSEDSSAAVVNVTMTTPVATKAASTPIYNLTSTMPPPVYTPPAGPLTQRSAAPAAPEATPSQQLQGGGDVHVHLHIGNVQAWDSRGVHDYLTGPEIRRHIAEAVRMHEGKR